MELNVFCCGRVWLPPVPKQLVTSELCHRETIYKFADSQVNDNASAIKVNHVPRIICQHLANVAPVWIIYLSVNSSEQFSGDLDTFIKSVFS